MTLNQLRPARARWYGAILVGLLFAGSWCSSGRADQLRQSTSLKFVPKNVAFYTASFRLREQLDAVLNSEAVARIKQIPLVQMGLAMAQAQWDNPSNAQVQMLKKTIERPENQELIQLLRDAFSDEIFLYGSKDFGDSIALINQMQTEIRRVQLAALAEGEAGEEQMAQAILGSLRKHLDSLHVPQLLVGYKVSDVQAAQRQIARLEALLRPLLAQVPQLQGRLQRQKVGDAQLLVLQLDGEMIPWEEVDREELGDAAADFDAIAKKLRTMTLAVGVGTFDQYLILFIGERAEQLARLGKGPLLASRKELAPVLKNQDRRLVSINYVSRRFMKQVAFGPNQLQQYVALVEMGIKQSGLDPSVQEELIDDLHELVDELTGAMVEPAAMSGYSFLTDRGYEGFAYYWGQAPALDDTKPLGILQHVGGTPLALLANRSRGSAEGYELLRKWVARTVDWGMRIARSKLEEDKLQKVEKVYDRLWPLLQDWDDVTRLQLLPALATEESALVVDAKSTSRQWHERMPAADQPLPMLEIGLVMGVNDEQSARRAGQQYFAIAQQMADALHEMAPDQMPQIKLPRPQVRQADAGAIYYWTLPARWGLASQIAPNVGLASDVLAVSLLPDHTARLLKATPLEIEAPLLKADKPLAAASYCNVAGFVEACEPWIDYAIGQLASENPAAAVWQQYYGTFLDLIKCFRSITSVTYHEGDAWVTHTEFHFKDLEPKRVTARQQTAEPLAATSP